MALHKTYSSLFELTLIIRDFINSFDRIISNQINQNNFFNLITYEEIKSIISIKSGLSSRILKMYKRQIDKVFVCIWKVISFNICTIKIEHFLLLSRCVNFIVIKIQLRRQSLKIISSLTFSIANWSYHFRPFSFFLDIHVAFGL